MMDSEPNSNPDEIDVYRQLDEYQWDQDKEFLGGLSAILGPDPIQSQILDLTLRARCFYFSRKISSPISFDGYKSYLLRNETLHSTCPIYEDTPFKTPQRQAAAHHQAELSSHESTPDNSAPYPNSFGEIIELIASGTPIPGIRDIPSTIVPEQASIAKAPARKKPWDKELPRFNTDRDNSCDEKKNVILKKNLEK